LLFVCYIIKTPENVLSGGIEELSAEENIRTEREEVIGRAAESVHKSPTPTPQFLDLRLRLLRKRSVCINNGKPAETVNGIISVFISTT
jgi:hypothetical protein